jgi:hypothetical protein
MSKLVKSANREPRERRGEGHRHSVFAPPSLLSVLERLEPLSTELEEIADLPPKAFNLRSE